MARYRGTTAERGLGSPHQRDGKRLKRALREGEPCWRCGQPMYSWQNLERDHVIARALGGANGPALLAHARCNRSAGATLGNQLRGFTPAAAMAGHNVTCKACGKPYHYAARSCEICGLHYHPSYGEQRTCSRTCGVILQKHNRMARGWVPKAQRPKPPPKVREPKNWPSSRLQHYVCRYCGTPGVTKVTGQPREVCPAALCQALRLNENRTRHDGRPRNAGGRYLLSVRTAEHKCPGCGQPTVNYRWCDACLCVSTNAKGKRCQNKALIDGTCASHTAAA